MVKYIPTIRWNERFPFPDAKDGVVSAEWEEFHLTYISLPAPLLLWDGKTKVSRIRCHRDIAASLTAALSEIYGRNLWKHIKEFLGCYNYRRVRNGKEMSRHSWGLAIDFEFVDWVPPKGMEWLIPLMQKPEPPKEIIEIFVRNGFYWGGWFSNKDAMHFELGG